MGMPAYVTPTVHLIIRGKEEHGIFESLQEVGVEISSPMWGNKSIAKAGEI